MAIKEILRKLGVNKAVFFGVITKLWFGLGGFITIFVIARYFSPELQGYYFTFNSLIALRVFVELGLTFVTVYFASHEWAKLKFDDQGRATGDPGALSRLKSLAKIVSVWFSIGGVLVAIGLGIAGYIFFSRSGSVPFNWVAPWFALCFLTGANLALMPAFSLLEGCNQVAEVYFFRFIYEVLRFVATWIIIVFGGQLWAVPAAALLPLLWAGIFLFVRYRAFFTSLFAAPENEKIDWRAEIWPMQWKIAVSWLGGYMFFSLFIPAAFYFQGAVEAGRMGMTWAMVQALSMISYTWIATRTPRFGMHVAKKEFKELDRLFFRLGLAAFSVATFGAIVVFGFVWLLNYYQFSLASRFLPLEPTLFFLLGTIMMQISHAESTYLRAHKREPFMWLGVVSAGLMILALWLTGQRWGTLGFSIAFAAIASFIIVPVGTIIWARCRKLWHEEKGGLDESVDTLGNSF